MASPVKASKIHPVLQEKSGSQRSTDGNNATTINRQASVTGAGDHTKPSYSKWNPLHHMQMVYFRFNKWIVQSNAELFIKGQQLVSDQSAYHEKMYSSSD